MHIYSQLQNYWQPSRKWAKKLYKMNITPPHSEEDGEGGKEDQGKDHNFRISDNS